jgi:fused signal recognition particle receptor
MGAREIDDSATHGYSATGGNSLEIVYILIGVVLLAGAYFLFFRSKEPALPEREQQAIKPSRPAQKKADPKKVEEKRPAKADKAPASDDADEDEAPVSVDDASEEKLAASPPPAPASRRKKDVKGLRQGLKKVRESGGLFGRLKELFGGAKEIDPALIDEIEEILLTSDVGVATTQALLDDIRDRLEKNELADASKVWRALQERATDIVDVGGGGAIRNHGIPTVVLMVGVNGSGKTTTIGKLATKFVEQEKKVLLVAGDTFRAAAVAQLKAWGKRTKCEVFAGKDGVDPASVVFDAVKHATDEAFDVVLVDTAGRLHTKTNLMDELVKVLVVDGTTGQNALQQAAEFGEALDLSGIVLTKLDGTAKGGVVLAIAKEHRLPVRYVGVGERPQDLRDFDAEEFVEAMLGLGDDNAQAA